MQFIVKQRDGPARIGEIDIENKKVKTPNIFFLNTKRFKSPSFSEIDLPKLIEKEINVISAEDDFKKITSNLVIIKYAAQLINQPKNFVDFIVRLREKIGYQKTIYLPGVGDPSNLALLAYLGIDFFDSAPAIVAARKNMMFFENGNIKKDDLQEIFCNCPICNKKTKPEDLSYNDILNHNYNKIYSELKQVRNSIAKQNLRNLVENKLNVDSNSAAILKNFDRKYYEFLERRAPVASKNKLIATSKESMNRPEIKRFQERVISRYKKPESAKVLLLLPCSAKKPYFRSKSHKFFRNILMEVKNPTAVHELIITSPLGLVPRELELTYPAANYDIPVTGVWEDYEKEMIKNLLSNYIKKNKYEKIIAHLPKEIISFIKPIIKNAKITCIDNPTSKESLDKLKDELDKTIKNYDKITNQNRAIEEIQGLARYQFGEKNAICLLKNSTIKGKYPYRKIFENDKQLGMITQERGLISLTLDGAKKINDYSVNIYDDFELKGSVFAPGVKDADDAIRIGDEVIVKNNKETVAVGVAHMNSEEMTQSTYGEAVKVRHKI